MTAMPEPPVLAPQLPTAMPPAPVKLVHACVHGVLHHAGVKHSEGVVQALSYGLADLVYRNGWTVQVADTATRAGENACVIHTEAL